LPCGTWPSEASAYPSRPTSVPVSPVGSSTLSALEESGGARRRRPVACSDRSADDHGSLKKFWELDSFLSKGEREGKKDEHGYLACLNSWVVGD
jgi:hypothetical protein